MPLPAGAADLFAHVSADKAAMYRAVLEVFAQARKQYRLQLRPDEVLAEADWPGAPPRAEELAVALKQLVDWGNLQAQADIARVATLADYYRARWLYRLSQHGEAVEAALERFAQQLGRRAELQAVALEDIEDRLRALAALLDSASDDIAKFHETLRDLIRVFESLADNAQAFMAGVARSLELQQADEQAVVAYKSRLIDYLQHFLGDLVTRSDAIARLLLGLAERIDPVLLKVAEREARDAAPGPDEAARAEEQGRRWRGWRQRWAGLARWFVAGQQHECEAELLRARARAAIPQLLGAVAAVNDRRSGRSDRAADFRLLAGWFAACENDADGHRLARAALALNPARHLALNPADDGSSAATPWAQSPPLQVHPRLREQGQTAPRGPQPRVRQRDAERAQLAALMHEESRQLEAAQARFVGCGPLQLSRLQSLDAAEFDLLLSLLGQALAAQGSPEDVVQRDTADGLFRLHLQPLGSHTTASIETPLGRFMGRDHLITVSAA